ncbi:5-formyltetrahydrofolate cyclo-ligase [Natrialba asiatica]|uniref:5-formyltetrahydrofolate cyclo-ligase n=1 Tax=Natrialba asiatica (strain ATCC 700177 / DSM 12278 / JCM 9576 / FERM P-10747 / NBRC 102637 / 172P1) TaxID=29540 RepID=M0APH8_NATA1|nr:5-formyltetrahydrofolate cyclo-ligase [Natrialba asiatica]ELY99288.1 5-formyltetrahydrofolate cyclo-ligase [Natrialba asiatica DSM 12278]
MTDRDTLSKEAVRERVWDDLEDSGVARFPFPPHGRIPNFENATDAATRLAAQPEWQAATTIKANPDAPQLPVRRRALRDGKTVYMAVPRLRDEQCFLKLDPDELEDYDAATTVSGSADHGEQVGPAAVDEIDLIVSGSVAVCIDPAPVSNEDSGSVDGGRIGKGEGYSDLEFAILAELELVDEETPVATTVHERQLLAGDDAAAISFDEHDVPMDLVVTPERVRRPAGQEGENEAENGTRAERPYGIDWSLLSAERREAMPVLDRLSEQR